MYIILLLLLFNNAQAEFTDHFRHFLKKNYGAKIQEQLERIDLGLSHWCSFGGKLDENDPVNKRPVLFVHGALSQAGIFLQHRAHFIHRGYSPSELYATSYADGLNTIFFDGVHCKYIKQIRAMLIAVNNYTGKTIDIIVHSMGSAVTRKAILGNRCFDTDEALGPPLTNIVNTFVTVGGANYGLENCPPITALCGNISSLHCASKLMEELNSQPYRFEGHNSYDIYSRDDTIIGLKCCRKSCGVLRNHNTSFEVNNLDHFLLLPQTIPLQLLLLRRTDEQDNSNSIVDVDDVDAEDEALTDDGDYDNNYNSSAKEHNVK